MAGFNLYKQILYVPFSKPLRSMISEGKWLRGTSRRRFGSVSAIAEQIAEGEEIFAAGAKIFCFREAITQAYLSRLRKWGG